MDEKRKIALTVNGRVYERTVPVRLSLADFIRDHLHLTGTHLGCEHGVCGACTILLDGLSARSCLMLAVQAQGRRIDTVEGLAGADGALGALQRAFRRHHALQCGFCTPGILMSLADWLKRTPDPDEAAVREMLSGHLCRCTGYSGIVRAALEAAAELRREGAKEADDV